MLLSATRRQPSRTILCAALVLAPSSIALGGGVALQLVSKNRAFNGDSFVVSGGNMQDIDSLSYGRAGLFDESFLTLAALPAGEASLAASQSSDIAPFGVSGSGSATSSSELLVASGFCYSVGETSCAVEFDIPFDAPFRIVASLESGATSRSKLYLHGPDGFVVNVQVDGSAAVVRESGTLTAGRYQLHVSSFASTSLLSEIDAVSDSADFSMHFSTSESAADLSNDGIVDAEDFGLLLADWGPCDACAADLDANGWVDGADVGMLLGSWG